MPPVNNSLQDNAFLKEGHSQMINGCGLYDLLKR